MVVPVPVFAYIDPDATNAHTEGGMGFLKIHRRLSIKERGHLPNTLRLRPIKEIATNSDGVAIYKGGRKMYFSWSEIEGAHVVIRESVKGYGAAAGMDYLKKTFVFKARGRTHKFDVSSVFPDFSDNSELLATLYDNLNITEVKARSSNDSLYNVIVMGVLLALVYLLWDY